MNEPNPYRPPARDLPVPRAVALACDVALVVVTLAILACAGVLIVVPPP